MRLVVNDRPRHIDVIRAGLRSADRIIILAAFFHSSGLSQIESGLKVALKRGTKITIVIGLDLYLTEPRALSALLKMLEGRPNAELFLFRKGRATYHPKLYYWSLGDTATVVVGSANLTGGGLE